MFPSRATAKLDDGLRARSRASPAPAPAAAPVGRGRPRHASYLELFFDAGLIAVAALGGGLDPVVFTALTTAVLVALVVFKLWSAHRQATAIAPLVEA